MDFPGAWHHVMNKGARGTHIFRDDDDRFDFISLLADASRRYRIEVNAFALMGTHYHIVVRSSGALSQAMRHIDGVFAQRFNRRHGLDGSVYKDRFRSKLIDTDGYLDRAVRYVHRNPLEARLVEDLTQYRWSSYPMFLSPPEQRPEWLFDTSLAISQLDTPKKLRRYTEADSSDADIDFNENSLAIGSAEFISAMMQSAYPCAETVGGYRATALRPTIEMVDSVVANFFGCDPLVLLSPTRGQLAKARLIALGLGQELAGLTLSDLADRYGYASSKSAGAGTKRFRDLCRDTAWRLIVEEIHALLEGTPLDEICRRQRRR